MITRRALVAIAFAIGLAVVALLAPAALAQGGIDPGVVVFASDRSGNYEIYALDPATGLTTQLTNTPANDVEPVWSPDGQFIAFASDRDGDYELFVMRADGTDARQLTNNLAEDRQPRWQPDGANLAFVSDVNGQWDVYIISADGAMVRQLTNDLADERGPDAGRAPGAGEQPAPTQVPPGVMTVAPSVDGVVDTFQLNVRQNPGEGGRVLGFVPRDTPLRVLGQNYFAAYDELWLQVQTPTGIIGWVAGWLIELNIEITSVPFVNAQYLFPPPTPTPTPAATLTPTLPPVSISFYADKGTINQGECVTIRWAVEGIREVYYQGVGVTGSESRQECPAQTTTYHLRVIKIDGSIDDRYITITVN